MLRNAQSSPGDSAANKRSLRARQAVNYDENSVNWESIAFESSDEEEDKHAQKRNRSAPKPDASQADQLAAPSYGQHLEEETAWALGFNALSITDEEEDLLRPGANEAIYVQMRNHVLTLWRQDVSRFLSEADALASVQAQNRMYAGIAWRFLNAAGYINFGVAPALLQRHTVHAQSQGSVVIVGAGLAERSGKSDQSGSDAHAAGPGLAAAQQLRAFGYQVVVLEGRSRVGGRVYTKTLQGGGQAAAADLGGSILTGIDANPLAVLAAQLDIPLHDINTAETDLLLEGGAMPDPALDRQVEAEFNAVLEACDKFRGDMGEVTDHICFATAFQTLWERLRRTASGTEASASDTDGGAGGGVRPALEQRLVDWHLANLEFANAARLQALSLRSWDQDDEHEVPGAHCFLPGGNARLVAALAEGLPVVLNSIVREVRYCRRGVAVRTATHEFHGDAVVVTVPLGVLKRDLIAFSPPLTPRKRDAIHRMGFGLLNKVALLFPYAFWPAADMFGRIAPSTEERGEFFLFYSYTHISGGALLAALVSGEAAERMEQQSPRDVVRKLMQVLCGLFEPKGIKVPAPLEAACTRWGADPMAFGAYSSVAVGALGGEDYDILAESVGGRLFFAGEATTRKYPATMHGAFLSGLREGANVAATLRKAAADAGAARAAAAREAAGAPPCARHDGALAPARVAAAMEAAQLAACLTTVFGPDGPTPDAEFGCFSALYGPASSEFAGEALLCVRIGSSRGGAAGRAAPQVVFATTVDHVETLADLPRGDDARFNMVAGLLGERLVGRTGLSPRAFALAHAILAARGLAPLPAFSLANKSAKSVVPFTGLGGKASLAPLPAGRALDLTDPSSAMPAAGLGSKPGLVKAELVPAPAPRPTHAAGTGPAPGLNLMPARLQSGELSGHATDPKLKPPRPQGGEAAGQPLGPELASLHIGEAAGPAQRTKMELLRLHSGGGVLRGAADGGEPAVAGALPPSSEPLHMGKPAG